MIGMDVVVSCLLGGNLALFGIIVRQNALLARKLDNKVDEKTCVERRTVNGTALKRTDTVVESLWNAIHNHGHTGLSKDSSVIRGTIREL